MIKNIFLGGAVFSLLSLGCIQFGLPHTGYAKHHGLRKVDTLLDSSFASLVPVLKTLPNGSVEPAIYLECRKYGPNNGYVEYPDGSGAPLICDKSVYRTYDRVDIDTYERIDKTLIKAGWQHEPSNSELVYTKEMNDGSCRFSFSGQITAARLGSTQHCSYYLHTVFDW